MSRYLVPLVLIAWAASEAAGCDWTVAWLIILTAAAVVQAFATAKLYREHFRDLR